MIYDICIHSRADLEVVSVSVIVRRDSVHTYIYIYISLPFNPGIFEGGVRQEISEKYST